MREAKRLPLGRPDVHGLPPAQARALTSAAEQASLHSFHLGMAIAAVLVAAGGRGGSGGDPQPPQARARRGAAPAVSWWAPSSELASSRRGAAALEAQPTGSRA